MAPMTANTQSSAAGHTQLLLGNVEVLGASRGESPLIIADLNAYPELRRSTGAPHSTLKSR